MYSRKSNYTNNIKVKRLFLSFKFAQSSFCFLFVIEMIQQHLENSQHNKGKTTNSNTRPYCLSN